MIKLKHKGITFLLFRVNNFNGSLPNVTWLFLILPGCGGKPADVIFVLDASSSIWGPDFDKQVDFVHSVVAEFDVASSATRVGLITFSDAPEVVIALDEYNDRYTTNGRYRQHFANIWRY